MTLRRGWGGGGGGAGGVGGVIFSEHESGAFSVTKQKGSTFQNPSRTDEA